MNGGFTAVVAARDEQERLPATLDALMSLPNFSHLVVADDGSRDSTARLARQLGAEVVSLASPSGKGAALRAGILAARRSDPGGPLLLADADLGASAVHLSQLLQALDDDHPVCVAAFPNSAGGGFGLVKRHARRAIARRTGHAPLEPLSGQRALLPRALESLGRGIAPGFGAEVGMTLDLLAVGITPHEVTLPLTNRPTGKTPSGFIHRARQGLDVLKAFKGERIPWHA